MCIDRTSIRPNYSEDSFVSRRGSDDWGDLVSKCWKIFGRAFFKQYDVRVPDTCTFEHFWDMQQNQEIHKDADWQDKMVEIEMRVSDMNG